MPIFFAVAAPVLMSTLSYVSVTYVLYFMALCVGFYILANFRLFLKALSKNRLLFGITIFATFYAAFGVGLEFSFWQIARSQIWMALGLPIAWVIVTRIEELSFQQQKSVVRLLGIFVTVCAGLGILEILLQNPLAPAYIRAEGRIYTPVSAALPGLIWIFLHYKKWIPLLLTIFLALITFGKGNFILIIYAVLVYVAYSKYRKQGAIKKVLYPSLMMVAGAIIAYVALFDRISFLFSNGDPTRWIQIIQSLALLSQSPEGWVFGFGIGTRLIDGPYLAAYQGLPEDAPRLVINSQYDIENGYIYQVLRFGLMGTILWFSFALKLFSNFRFAFLVFFLVFCATTSLTGIAPSITLLSIAVGYGLVFNGKHS